MMESTREMLVAQCAYLIEEINALQPLLLERVPEDFVALRPLGKWSIKETFGHLADCDRDIFRPRIETMMIEDRPTFEDVDQDALVVVSGWQDRSLPEVLDAVREQRASTVSLLQSVPEDGWSRVGIFPDGEERDLVGLAAYIARHDAHHLRALGYRLHESHITQRSQDLPK